MSNETSKRGALVLFPGALGDFVCLVPALRELEHRYGTVTLVCKGDLVPLARLVGAESAYSIDGRIGLWPFLAEPPDEAVEFFGAHAAIHSFSGHGFLDVEENLARLGAGRARVHAFRPDDPIHLADHYLRCVGATGQASGVGMPDTDLAAALAAVPDPLAERPGLVVHPGSGGLAKRWSRSGFEAIARRWRARTRSPVVVLLGPVEQDEHASWSEAADLVVRAPELVAAARTLSLASAYLGNDSGISHLAGLVGTRGVALFGPTDPRLWRPLSNRLTALRLAPWSSADSTASADVIEAVWRALAEAAALP